MRPNGDGYGYGDPRDIAQQQVEQARREVEQAHARLELAERKVAILRDPYHELRPGQARLIGSRVYVCGSFSNTNLVAEIVP